MGDVNACVAAKNIHGQRLNGDDGCLSGGERRKCECGRWRRRFGVGRGDRDGRKNYYALGCSLYGRCAYKEAEEL